MHQTTNDFSYKTYIKTPLYHIVTGKQGVDKACLSIERNDLDFLDSQLSARHQKVPNIKNYSKRPPIITDAQPPNPNRFEQINVFPDCHTMQKHVVNVKFDK
mmetsp:Transcript_4504/g.6776  ORF Transcript_4504/g.6776 Transcript_4504/m.6776 type:complete len:102 (+) Transcript_4504:993-1298(+)